MALIKANEPIGERPAILVLYGDPGICKTSLGNTCDLPLLLDFDRGVNRSILRKDALLPEDWAEVLKEEANGTFKGYKTIIIDTAKAALDDFLMGYVVDQDYKLRSNKLGAYGAIGDGFKLFVNNRRRENADILIIAHSKKDEDTKKWIPDVTGQSYQLLMRIADQVGYVTMENNQRTLRFEPSDLTVGKNVACIDKMIIPDKADPAFRTFGADLFTKVRSAIAAMSEEQREALEISASSQQAIAECQDPAALTEQVSTVNSLPDYLKLPLRKLIAEKADQSKWTWDKETSAFKAAAEDPKPDESKATDPVVHTFASIFEALGNCKDVEEISTLYMENAEFIEADTKLKAIFDNAAETVESLGATPTETLFPSVPATDTASKVSPFKKKYDDANEISTVLDTAAKVEDIANLYYINAELVEANPELKAKFTQKKNDFFALVLEEPKADPKSTKTGKGKKEVAHA